MSSVALANGLNANMLRGWLARERKALAAPEAVAGDEDGAAPAFVPVKLDEQMQQAQDIRIELRRSATVITVTWPVSAAADCAAWMRELLR